MCRDVDLLILILNKVNFSLERIISNSREIDSPDYYCLTPDGLERLESTCMLLIAIGESVKGIDKITSKQLLVKYPSVDWKGVMGIRDVIAHHYFDLDAEIVFDVVKNNIPQLHKTINQIIADLQE